MIAVGGVMTAIPAAATIAVAVSVTGPQVVVSMGEAGAELYRLVEIGHRFLGLALRQTGYAKEVPNVTIGRIGVEVVTVYSLGLGQVARFMVLPGSGNNLLAWLHGDLPVSAWVICSGMRCLVSATCPR
jgi:hypothetical protein